MKNTLPLQIDNEISGLFGLRSLLTGKALDIYSGLSSEDAWDYDKLQKALLKRYDFTEQGYCERFKNDKPEGQESPGQSTVRILWEMDSLVLKTGEEIIVLNGAGMEAEIKDNLPVTKVANNS